MACKVQRQLNEGISIPEDISLASGKVVKIGGVQVVGAQGAMVTPTQAALTLTSMTGAANTAPAAETNINTVTDGTTGTPATPSEGAVALAEVTGAANAGSADVAPVKNALATLAAELNRQKALNTVLINNCKSFATQLNAAKTDLAAVIALLKAHGLMASS